MTDKDVSRLSIPQSSNISLSLKSEISVPSKRQKIPLRPGHSLADWIKICRENPGIAKVSRSTIDETVSIDELAEHSSESDCWIALRGKVFNVTPYLDFHPGGSAEILQFAGKDATTAFDEIHAWVNYESLLRACYVGPYGGTVKPRIRLNDLQARTTKFESPRNTSATFDCHECKESSDSATQN